MLLALRLRMLASLAVQYNYPPICISSLHLSSLVYLYILSAIPPQASITYTPRLSILLAPLSAAEFICFPVQGHTPPAGATDPDPTGSGSGSGL